jgi:long-chain acyl-CoA synthetase
VSEPALPAPPTILDALRASVEAYPERRALVCRGRQLDYAELGREVASAAERLSALGVAGTRVVLLMPTGIDAIVAVLAVLAAGAQVVPVNPFFTPSELSEVLRAVDAGLVLSGPEAWDKLGELALPGIRPLRFPLAATGDGAPPAASRGGGAGAGQAQHGSVPIERGPAGASAASSAALAVGLFTGGTTGEPKAVEHTHASLMVSVLQHCTVWPVRFGEEIFLSAAPIFHVWGLFYAVFVPLYAGGTLVLLPRFDAQELLAAIDAERASVLCGGPAPVYTSLLASPRCAQTDFSSLRYCLTGGAPCPLELHERWQAATGCRLIEGWGMSEAAPLCLSRPSAPKPLSVGRPVPGTELEVVDIDGGERVLEAGEMGEVRVRGPQLMQGYCGRPDATAATIRHGWLYTGDIGYLDAAGDLFLVDRKKDMIIVGGYNVYPRLVDEVLHRHPAIAEAATVGRADARLGEVLVAFVVPRAGTALDEREFFAFCERELIKYRRPVAVTFLEVLPRTNARKVDKRALRARAAAGTPPA